MSLFRWIAGSQVRLAIAALIGVAVCVFVSAPAADYIRYASTSPVTNLLIKTGFAFLILATATFLAILVGDLVFPGRWRERVILGKRVAPVAPDDTLEAVKGLKSYYIHFSVMIAAFCVAGGGAIDNATHMFSSSEYTRTVLRANDDTQKLVILTELAGARTEKDVANALEILDTVWRDDRQPIEVRKAGLAALGDQIGYLVGAVETWRAEGRRESWQGELVLKLRKTLADDLRKLLPGAPPELRPLELYLLGQLQDVQANTLFLEELASSPDDTSPQWQAAMGALGAAHQASLLPQIVSKLDKARGDEAYNLVAWATQESVKSFYRAYAEPEEAPEELKKAIAAAVTFFSGELTADSIERRCVAAELLRFTGHVAARDALFAAFDAPNAKGAYCGQAKANVPAGDPGWIGTADELLRARFVQAIATISKGDLEIEKWIKAKLAAGGLDETTEALLKELGGH
ncbi:MAG: hypothetical protein EP329_19975 [Deltaproteobacteria bacterium]|nr:MAG: hypothetical protein EP329_19975 [Deltaproteobacteria bacterium]